MVNLRNKQIFYFRIKLNTGIIFYIMKTAETEKVRKAAINNGYKFGKALIDAALKSEVFMNLNENRPYSRSRVYGMLKEGKEWVTKRLVDYAKENPIVEG